ncbi:MAG: deoxyribonuclease IV [Candidatus Omnitrophica bacterium]|nr:deoxyribonuclease IV [Candidatus Omnitrophota bacterium]
MMRIGVHVSIVGGFLAALERATRLSCTTMQIFSRSPRGGQAPVVTTQQADEFDRQRRQAGIEPLAVHSPYIINLASPDRTTYGRSLAMYQEEYRRCDRLKADYLVTHVGSHRGQGEEAGIKRVAESLNRTLDDAPSSVTILLENTAGSGQGLGYQFEQLAAMREQVDRKECVGICLDTAHLFAAGIPMHTEDGLEEAVARFDRTIGLAHLKLVHLNDSKVAFDSHVDRHWHIGQGHIGLEAIRRFVNHPRLRHLPFILETPKDTEDDDPRNLAIVRSLVSQRRVGEITKHQISMTKQ